MKKFNFKNALACLGAFGMLFVSSCSEDTPAALEIDKQAPTSIELAATGAAQSYSFVANEEWAATSSEKWAVVSPASGKGGGKATISITAAAYNEITAREAKITITAGSAKIELAVKQAAATPAITFDPATLTIPQTLSATVKVLSNVEYTVKSLPEWIETITLPTVTKGENTLTIVAKNTDPAVRTGSIVFAQKDGKYESPLAVSMAAVPDMKGEMSKTDFAANQWYLMPTNIDILVTNATEGNFEFTALELTGTTPSATKAAWLTFEKNADRSSANKIYWMAKASDYTSKTATRTARIYLAPKGTTPAQLIAAADRFKVKDVKQFPDAIQFSIAGKTGTYRGIKSIEGFMGDSFLLTVLPNGSSFAGTFGYPVTIDEKNTFEQVSTAVEMGKGVFINQSTGGELPTVRAMHTPPTIGSAGYINYVVVDVTIEGTTVSGLFKMNFIPASSPMDQTQTEYYN